MAFLFTKVARIMFILGFIAFLSFGFLGISHSSMTMSEDGNMPTFNCPFMSGKAVVCNMNPLQHIAAWQSMFTTALQQNGSDLLMLLLAALALALVWTKLLWSKFAKEPKLAMPIIARRENYLPPSPLQELFSNGILNPKVF